MENACSGGVPAMPPPSSTCADSSDSSPRSRAGEPLDEPYLNAAAAAAAPKFRFMCSYGGHIVPRPHDKSLCYLGGETRIVVVERHTTLSDLSSKLSRSLLSNRPFTLKYQLPSEDLDSLISVTTDEDLDNMIEEYDRIAAAASGKASRLRLFLFPVKVESPCPSTSSIGSLLDDSKSETWFVDALNGAIGAGGVLPRGLSGDSGASSVNCLLGLEDEHNNNNNPAIVPQPLANVTAGFSEHNNDLHNLAPSHHTDQTAQLQLPLPRPDSNGKLKVGHEVHSVPDSPMMDTTSSFGSASSAPSLSHLPPIRVRQDDQSPQKRGFGLEEQFSHMNFHKQEDDFKPRVLAHVAIPLAAVAPTPFATPPMAASPRENPGHAGRAVSSDEEKLEIPCSRKLPQILAQQQNVTNIPVSDRPVYYEERTDPAVATWDTVSDVKKEVQSSAPESNYRAQVQVSEQGYVLPVQPDHLQQQQLQEQQPQKQQHQPHHHQQQQQPQEQQQQSQQQQQQQQQYTHAAPHLVQHHPSNPSSHLIPQHPSAQMIPIQSYYQMHQIHPQQQLPQNIPFNSQIPMYFVQIPQNPAYAVPIQQPNLVDGSMVSAKPAIPMPSQILQPRGVASQNPDLAATSNVYRTNATTASVVSQSSPAPQLIHIGDQTHQFIPGYQRVQHHPSQSAASTYGYEFSNQLLSQPMFYGQAVSNPLPSHYQAISSAATVMSHSQPQLQQQQQQVLDGNHNKASS